MSYNNNLDSMVRTKITLVEIDLDICVRTFGVGACLAVGNKCFNTAATCSYKQAYLKTVKTYRFCDSDIVGNPDGYRPYLQDVSIAPTELQEDKTVPQRVTLKFIDEPDTDLEIDPYFESREYSSSIDKVPGTFFKKLIARNANIKGRIVRIKEGFLGDDLNEEYKDVFTGKIEDYETLNGSFTLKCVDLLKSLSDYKYPFRINSSLTDVLPQIHDANTEEEMLKLNAQENDYCKRNDFQEIKGVHAQMYPEGGTLAKGIYTYKIFAFNSAGFPIGYNIITIDLVNNFPNAKAGYIIWNYLDGASFYRVYGRDENPTSFVQTNNNSIYDDGGNVFNISQEPPDGRIFKFLGGSPSDINNWIQTDEEFAAPLDDVSMLRNSGYLKIEDEIIYYSGVTTAPLKMIRNLKRGLFGTKSERHSAGAAIYFIVSKDPGNPFSHLKSILDDAGIDIAYLDLEKFNSLEASWNGIKFSCRPIAKDTDLAKIYYDLVNALDAKSWQNEKGKITIKMNSESAIAAVISDDSNIIEGSGKVENNQKEIYTRLSFYWNLLDSTKSITDKEAFGNLTISADSDAESENEYNEVLNKDLFSAWINSDCGTSDTLDTYVNKLLEMKLKRFRDARPILSFDVEMKDSAIKVGDIITVKTDELNDVYGNDLSGEYEVIKREVKANRISLSVKSHNLLKELYVDNSKLNLKIIKSGLNLIEIVKDEIETKNLQYYTGSIYQGGSNLNVKLNKNEITLRWDNGYTRTDLNIISVTGQAQILKSADVHKTIKGYNVYQFIANDDAAVKKSANQRPSTNDANGKWQLIKFIPDRKITDAEYKYLYTIKGLKVGKYYDFYVSEVMKLDTVIPIVTDSSEI